jgi:hypothetical protein
MTTDDDSLLSIYEGVKEKFGYKGVVAAILISTIVAFGIIGLALFLGITVLQSAWEHIYLEALLTLALGFLPSLYVSYISQTRFTAAIYILNAVSVVVISYAVVASSYIIDWRFDPDFVLEFFILAGRFVWSGVDGEYETAFWFGLIMWVGAMVWSVIPEAKNQKEKQ